MQSLKQMLVTVCSHRLLLFEHMCIGYFTEWICMVRFLLLTSFWKASRHWLSRIIMVFHETMLHWGILLKTSCRGNKPTFRVHIDDDVTYSSVWLQTCLNLLPAVNLPLSSYLVPCTSLQPIMQIQWFCTTCKIHWSYLWQRFRWFKYRNGWQASTRKAKTSRMFSEIS